MAMASGGRVWDLPVKESNVPVQKKFFSKAKIHFLKWLLCFIAVGVLPLSILGFLKVPVWTFVPSNLKSVAGGYIEEYRGEFSLGMFLLYVGVMILSIALVSWMTYRFYDELFLFTPILFMVIFAFIISMNANGKYQGTSFDDWAKTTYGYQKVNGGKPSLNDVAVRIENKDGVQTTANVLRSDGNIYLYENVVQEEELVNKIKAEKAAGK